MSGRTGGPQQNLFLNRENYNKIVGFLRSRYAKKLGVSALPEKVDEKLQKYTQHFMTEVNRVQGANQPQNSLATEVVRETETSMDTWLRKQQAAAPPTTTTIGTFPRGEEMSRLFQDTGARYENLMASRAPIPIPQVGLPDFRAPEPELDEEEDPVLLMQRAQKQRDDQARALGITNANFPNKKVESAQAGAGSVLPPRMEIRDEAPPSAMNPTPPQADPPPPSLAPRPQDYIIPQEDVVKYRETEYNVFITSADRNWMLNTAENRYNFSVIFNTGNTTGALGYNSAVQQRFRNIQRIEFVKAIVPIESLSALVRVTDISGTSAIYDTSRVVNIFSFPFTGVRIAELNNNSFSTNPNEDNTFAIVQYDTTWSSDLVVPQSYLTTLNTGSASGYNAPETKSGYTGFIPKFLKAQRIYAPTPLATLNRLSIRMERHNTDLISNDPDVFSISRIQLSDALTNFGGTTVVDKTNYSSATNENARNPYIYIQTTNYFLFSAISEGDLINIQGCSVTPAAALQQATCTDFANYINQSAGQYVVATGYTANNRIYLGRNVAGYCNVIILRSRFDNPATTGGTTRTSSYFGGFLTQEENALPPTAGLAYTLNLVATVQTGCALINTSRQTNFVLRIITRDFDSASNIRPDNV